MNSSDYRSEGREKLSGKWGIAIGITILFSAISLLIDFLTQKVSAVFSLLTICIIPITFGLTYTFIKMFDGETVSIFDFITVGLQKFGRAWLIALHTIKKLIVPLLVLIIAFFIWVCSAANEVANGILTVTGNLSSVSHSPLLAISGIAMFATIIWIIVASYYYVMATYIAADDETISPRDAVEKSRELMTNNRGKLFILQLSFIGWFFLAGLIASILDTILPNMVATLLGTCWLSTYIQFATISFYRNLN